MLKLLIEELSLNYTDLGLAEGWGKMLGEAATICFHNQGHQSGVQMLYKGTEDGRSMIQWSAPTQIMLRNYSDPKYTTEFGAEAIAVLLAFELRQLKVIKRAAAKDGLGFDYWLTTQNTHSFMMQDKVRLEISGTGGGMKRLRARVDAKIKQIRKSENLGYPGLVIVVEFSNPFTAFIYIEEV